MKRNLKEKERMARRNVEKVRRALKFGKITTDHLMMLQQAHNRLLEIEIEKSNTLLDKPLSDMKTEEKPTIDIALPRYLYHGTSEKAAASILKEGLRPRGGNASNHCQAPSHPACVYLADAHALSYVIDSFVEGSRGAVLEIDRELLRPADLLPDEDALGPWCDPQRLIEQRRGDRDGLKWDTLFRSLYQHGTVAHHGTIPVNAISRVAYIPHSFLRVAMAKWRTTFDRSAIRMQQQGVLRWIFDGGNQPFPIRPEELVLNSAMTDALAYIPARAGLEPPRAINAGITADTLWRAYLMLNPETLNRQGVEILSASVHTGRGSSSPMSLSVPVPSSAVLTSVTGDPFTDYSLSKTAHRVSLDQYCRVEAVV